jgi:hypothetical protein
MANQRDSSSIGILVAAGLLAVGLTLIAVIRLLTA